MKASFHTIGLLIGACAIALLGAALKLLLSGPFDRLSIVARLERRGRL